MLALELLSPIAVTETTEVTTGVGRGWRRGGEGGDGVGTARSAAGAAPTEGLRQGHGLWPAPGFKGYTAHAADPWSWEGRNRRSRVDLK